MLAFSDADIIRMATDDFVALAGDDWYQRRRQDEVGKFWISIANQGPRREGGTRQGIYCFTGEGKLLAYKNAGQNPEVMRQVLKDALEKFRQLSPEKRKPGAATVGDVAKLDQRYDRTPPPGGLIVKVYTRILDRTDQGGFCKGTCNVQGGDQAARDHLWLTAAEWKGLVPKQLKPNERVPVPSAITERIARFHLVDNTRGEPTMWQRREIRANDLTLTVTEVTADLVKMKLEGSMVLATAEDLDKASRGFDTRLLGFAVYHRGREAFTQFDLAAVGEHWGRGTFTGRARPGRSLLGVAFELASGDSPEDRIPPQAARDLNTYLDTGR